MWRKYFSAHSTSPRMKQSFLSKKNSLGVALITALLVTALATIAAVAMMTRQNIDIRRMSNMVDADRAYLFSTGVESWAKKVLEKDAAQNNRLDHLGEDWATVLPPITVEGGKVAGFIEDMQSRFNINNLIKKDGKISNIDMQRFRRLLNQLDIDQDISLAFADWIDADDDVRFPAGAEDGEYLGGDTDYRTANQFMVSSSEILLVKGVTQEVYKKLLPHVTALPEHTGINVNTASPEVMMSLREDLTAADASNLIEGRGNDGYATVDEFARQPVFADKPINKSGLVVATDYFMINGITEFGAIQMKLFSLVARKGGKTRVLYRSENVL